MRNSDQLGFNKPDNPATCHIWSDPNVTTPEVFHSLVTYKKDIDKYNEIVKKFKPIPSIMDKLRRGGVEQQSAQQICEILRLHPDGMKGFFLASSYHSLPLDTSSHFFRRCNHTKSAKIFTTI